MPFTSLPLYFENTAGYVREHPAGYGVICYGAGKREAGSFVELGTRLGQLLVARRWTRFISDQRLLAPLSEAEKSWVTEYWIGQRVPRPAHLIEAILLASDVFTRLSLAQILNQSSSAIGSLTIQRFESEAAAHAWLLGQPQ
ncbi:hypothetical protein HHL22_06455 [Hymenobacter sp. RP-2-7]|uniref:STAS/SEC14 domain-containing protein n=1 Tax=Hymenobacter polaris TaxID=2682546 RepID=A0A7Y0FLI5_9BACT|nr:hypothetical protein [Hymenobacter polaris]NML64843.1 hypothetical protein [Hymenobacter polaris]